MLVYIIGVSYPWGLNGSTYIGVKGSTYLEDFFGISVKWMIVKCGGFSWVRWEWIIWEFFLKVR